MEPAGTCAAAQLSPAGCWQTSCGLVICSGTRPPNSDGVETAVVLIKDDRVWVRQQNGSLCGRAELPPPGTAACVGCGRPWAARPRFRPFFRPCCAHYSAEARGAACGTLSLPWNPRAAQDARLTQTPIDPPVEGNLDGGDPWHAAFLARLVEEWAPGPVMAATPTWRHGALNTYLEAAAAQARLLHALQKLCWAAAAHPHMGGRAQLARR
jgi:hypothetical protein